MRRALVTGGLGFIGSNFVRYLLNRYADVHVVNLDCQAYAGNPENLADIEGNPRYRFVKGDIRVAKEAAQALAGCDTIFHFAAQTHVDRSILSAEDFITTNVVGTQLLLEEARKIGLRRFIQISTDEVYGSIEKGTFQETAPLTPSSPYAASKACADLLIQAYHKTYGLATMITRCTNNFGPFQYPEKLIPLFITNALEGKSLPLYGDGLNVREWIYVLDHCEGLDLIWEKGEEGEIYNIGSGQSFSNLEMARRILQLLGKTESLIQFIKDRPAHDRRYALDTGKLQDLGWRPRFSFPEALRQTVEWYKTHSTWWQKLRQKGKEFQEYYQLQYGGKV
jgi:dTDP-glucose 4,6-dehydratase